MSVEQEQENLRQQLANAIQLAAKQDTIVWAVFGVFTAASAALLVALFPEGKLASAGMAWVLCDVGIGASLVVAVILGRAIAYFGRYERVVGDLERKLNIPKEVSLYFKVQGGLRTRPLMIACAWASVFVWLIGLFFFSTRLIRPAEGATPVSHPESVIDSLRHAVAAKDSLLAAALAQRETMVAAVHDTVVRVASASLGWWAELWRIVAQLGAAALAVVGGFLAQRYWTNREERRSEEAAQRTDDELCNQLAVGVSQVVTYLRPIRDQIVRGEAVRRASIEEVTRRVRSFEALLPRLFQLRDQEHATRLFIWYAMADAVPEALEVLAGNLSGRREIPEPKPLDPDLARIVEKAGKPIRTHGEVALQTIRLVLTRGGELGASLEIYDDGGRIVPMLVGRPRRATPIPRPPAANLEADSPPEPPPSPSGD